MEQLLNGGKTLQGCEAQTNKRERHNIQCRYKTATATKRMRKLQAWNLIYSHKQDDYIKIYPFEHRPL